MDIQNIRERLEQRLSSTKSQWDRLSLLSELSELSLHRQPARTYDAGQEILHIAKSLNDAYWNGLGHYYVGQYLSLKDLFSEAQFHFDNASDSFGNIGDFSMLGRVRHAIGELYLRTRQVDKAIEIATENLAYFQTADDPLWTIRAMGLLGSAYRATGTYARARVYLRQAVRNAKKKKEFTLCLPQLYYDLALTVFETGEFDAAKDYLSKGMSYAKAHQNLFEQGILYKQLAGLYQDSKEYAKAEKTTQQAIDLFRKLDLPGHTGEAIGTRSTSLMALDRTEEGQACEKEAIQLLHQTDNPVHKVLINMNIGKRHIQQEKYAEGIPLLHEAIDFLAHMHHYRYSFMCCWLLSDAYERIGNTEQALHFFKLYTEKQQEIVGLRQMNAIKDEEVKWATRISRAKTQRQKKIMTTMAENLRQKEQDVLALALQLTERSEQLAKLQQNTSHNNHLKPINSMQNNWETFAQQFYVVHRGFYSRLVQTYPELTSSELKICCLIRTGLSSKEIAHLLHVSPRTVDSHRERIRKKLPLPSRYSLANFMKAL